MVLAGGGLLHTGVVAGGDEEDAQLVGPGGQQLELHGGVAQHAGVGGASGAVGLAEGLHHLALELLACLDDLQRNAQSGGRLPGFLHRLVVGGGEADDRALHFKALLAHHIHADGAVHSAGKPHQHLVRRLKGGKPVAGQKRIAHCSKLLDSFSGLPPAEFFALGHRQPVAPLIFRVAGVALYPDKGDLMGSLGL